MDREKRYIRLSEPTRIGGMTLKNRMVMAAMGTALSNESGLVTKEMIAYYEARAKGGVGLIVVENACIDFPRGKQRSRVLSIDGKKTLLGLSHLAERIKYHGSRAAIQIHHAGRIAQSSITGIQPVAPSPLAAPKGDLPRELQVKEIQTIVQRFGEAALIAKEAGFDAVEIHGAHHYLIAQFLSLASNRRHDEYGGSVANRARILLEVMDAVRKAVGEDFPVWCRVNASEFGIDDGLSIHEALDIARMIDETSLNAISISAFGYGKFESTIKPETPGALIPLAAAVKEVVHKPVMAAGMITPEVGEQALEDGKLDLVVLGRALIADPDLPKKVTEGLEKEVRPCIGCYLCDDSRSAGGAIRCSVNAAAGRESEFVIRPLKKTATILVIGSGPAGMETARVAALRGCRVSVYEKEKRVGGQLILASVPPHKEKIRPLPEYFINQLRRLGVQIEIETEATPELIAAEKADVVVVATGVYTLAPPLNGKDLNKCVFAQDVLGGRAETGDRVVIVGGGMVGCETAELLEEKGRKVTLVEMQRELATHMRPTPRRKLLERIRMKPIDIFAEATCKKITEEGLVIKSKEGEEIVLPADTIVFATGGVTSDALYHSLKESLPELYRIGDCLAPRGIAEAIEEGMQIGLRVGLNDGFSQFAVFETEKKTLT